MQDFLVYKNRTQSKKCYGQAKADQQNRADPNNNFLALLFQFYKPLKLQFANCFDHDGLFVWRQFVVERQAQQTVAE